MDWFILTIVFLVIVFVAGLIADLLGALKEYFDGQN